jgi:hypothetical protein
MKNTKVFRTLSTKGKTSIRNGFIRKSYNQIYGRIIKINLSLYKPWRHSEEMEVQLHSLLFSSLDASAWSTLRPGRFTGGVELSCTHWIGGWVGPRAGLALVGKRYTYCTCCDSNSFLLFQGEGGAEGVKWPGCDTNQSLLSDAKGKLHGT